MEREKVTLELLPVDIEIGEEILRRGDGQKARMKEVGREETGRRKAETKGTGGGRTKKIGETERLVKEYFIHMSVLSDTSWPQTMVFLIPTNCSF